MRVGRLPVQRLFMVAIALILGFQITGFTAVGVAAAQEEEDILEVTDLDGIEKGIARTWVADLSSLVDADDPAAAMADLGLFSMVGMIAQFEDDDSAAAGFETMASDLADGLTSISGGPDLTEIDVDTIGDETRAFSAPYEEEGLAGVVSVVIAQDDDTVVMGLSISFDADSKPESGLAEFVEQVVDADAGGDEESFMDDGTSTGGLWEKFPEDDDEVLQDLEVSFDEDLMAIEEE